ncbi:helix-turn-helix domain-containing protein [Leptolyngbya sp. FACHB-321]|uniref:helix-turn-helix domain-containing protein n=1 Tax=Leptolyngbya sp. FACHB-321 TaxID=2692807 RepID=UPI0016855CAE|nr:helix-turn-helix domain-containing protein [Leptolyngbya sp. FACHB-321]MBD2036921.1 helix-turn-helix domain-containing protein [Leptolyngbya sp. FACHB-321]
MVQSARKPKQWKPPEKEITSVLFVHSLLDDYGLNVYEFRVLAHVARREGKSKQGNGKGCFARQRNIADICCMSHRKAQEVLRILCAAGLLEKESRRGGTNTYKIASPDKWRDPSELPSIRQKDKGDSSESSELKWDDDW